jgi:hypothetical protein
MIINRFIRYQTKPECTDENQRLIEGVFAALAAEPIPGVRYAAMTDGEGNFAHFVSFDDEKNALLELPAFRVFQENVEDRIADGPHVTRMTVIGNFRMLEPS